MQSEKRFISPSSGISMPMLKEFGSLGQKNVKMSLLLPQRQ
jgi:hypothetical protein